MKRKAIRRAKPTPTRQDIDHLQAAMSALPQIDLSQHTRHLHADGMYCRTLARPAGCLIVGKVHRREHFYIVAKGRVQVTNGEGAAFVYEAGEVIISKPGTKRAVLALEDSICMTVHQNPTGGTELEAIERELIEPDDTALFDARNQPRSLPCPG
jgi:quercetin dioxygenase-like cupin family protein